MASSSATETNISYVHSLLSSLEATALSATPSRSLESSDVRLLEQAMADAISANEELDDFGTAALRYLNVPYYLALANDAEGGLESKRRALAYYDGYLDRCLRHGVLEPNVRRWVEACLDSDRGEESDKRSPATVSREQKIEMFKTERQLAKSISALRAGFESTSVRGGDASRGNDKAGNIDELLDDTELRPLYLMMISQFAIKACNARQLVWQEVNMLEAVATMPEDARMKMAKDSRAQSKENQEVMDKLREAVRGLSAGTGGKREAFRAGVFKPSHLLPTMTVEQFGEMEVERMQAEEQRKVDASTEERRRRELSLNGRAEREAEEETALQKQRAFDDFKDANKRGSGNSKLRNTR